MYILKATLGNITLFVKPRESLQSKNVFTLDRKKAKKFKTEQGALKSLVTGDMFSLIQSYPDRQFTICQEN